jgi:hypothetical protein
MPKEAIAAATCDNGFTLYVNGKQAVTGKELQQPSFVDLLPHLRAGENVIAVAAVNNTPDNKPPRAEDTPKPGDANPAGFIFAARLRGGEVTEIVSDASWLWSKSRTNGWEKPAFNSEHWEQATELGSPNMKPWSLAGKLNQALSLAGVHGTVRSSLVTADPLMLALGRPNREQVTTTRQSAATTLQGLELTNGETLNKVLQRGAKTLLAGNKRSPEELVNDIFVKSLSRKPSDSELTLAKELLGSPVKEQGMEDLLWSVAMLPEFQLIY